VGQLFEALGLLGINPSALPAVIIILAVVIGSYVGRPDGRSWRTELEHMFASVTHGALSTLLGVASVQWPCSPFHSSTSSLGVRYLFLVLLALLVLGLLNGLVFIPVLLIIVGPPAQVTAQDSADSLLPAKPQPSPERFRARPPKL